MNVNGLVLAGLADLKEDLYRNLDSRLASAVLSKVDTCYGGRNGLNQAIVSCKALLSNIPLLEEVSAVSTYFDQVIENDSLICFGAKETLDYLASGVLDKLIIWDKLSVFKRTLVTTVSKTVVEEYLDTDKPTAPLPPLPEKVNVNHGKNSGSGNESGSESGKGKQPLKSTDSDFAFDFDYDSDFDFDNDNDNDADNCYDNNDDLYSEFADLQVSKSAFTMSNKSSTGKSSGSISVSTSNNVSSSVSEKWKIVSMEPVVHLVLNLAKARGTQVALISGNSAQGHQFVKGFGGIGGILRYAVHKDYDDLETGDLVEISDEDYEN